MTTKIEWVKNPDGTKGETWNPVVGCTRISPGCVNCYAARMAKRQAGMARARREKGKDPGRSAHYEKVESWDGVELVPEALGDPLGWRKPRRVFACSMSDLFHEDVRFTYVLRIFDTMFDASQHTFQILTKRPGRMLKFSQWAKEHYDRRIDYPNIWLGVTAENQAMADERIPVLLQIPAAVRFVSAEPLLSGIDLQYWLDYDASVGSAPGLDLVIVGAETGPGKRPMQLDWARSLRDQCQAAGVSFFFKKDSDGNRELDGRLWEEMPE